jgi:hypothetical protein
MARAVSLRVGLSSIFARAISKRMPASRSICARRGEADARINFIAGNLIPRVWKQR